MLLYTALTTQQDTGDNNPDEDTEASCKGGREGGRKRTKFNVKWHKMSKGENTAQH